MPEQKKVIIQRAWQDKRVTMGMLTIVGVDHDPFYTLENPVRDDQFDSLIPAGTYECVPYSGSKYQDVYLVQNVHGRSGILIHWGNYESDTLGCILVGGGSGMMSGHPAVTASKLTFARLQRALGKEPFTLMVQDIASA